MSKPDTDYSPTQIPDKWIFLGVYPLMALLVVHIGNDNSLMSLLRIPSYYTDLLFALGATFGAGLYFRWLYRWLDKKFGGSPTFSHRVRHQLLAGLLLPVSVIMGLECLYLLAIGIPLSQSPMLYLELPLTTLFCVLINLLYISLYHRGYLKKVSSELDRLQRDQASSQNSTPPVREDLLVSVGAQSRKIMTNDIAYFLITDGNNYLVTRQGERFLYSASQSQLLNELDSASFYAINRQVLAHRQSIVSFERTSTRKLQLTLVPSPDVSVYVSKNKASDFLSWFEQNRVSASG